MHETNLITELSTGNATEEMTETEEKAKTKEDTFVYDARATQVLTFETTDGDIKHTLAALSDDRYIQFIKECGITTNEEGEVDSESLAASIKLWDELCENVEGYEGDKTADWKTYIDILEKQFAITHYLQTNVFEKKVLGQNKTLILECFYNGKPVELRHEMKPKTLEHIKEFQKILRGGIERDRNKKLKSRSKRKYAQNTMELAELCKKLHVSATGYAANDIPVWHYCDLIIHYLSADISEKK